MKKMFIILMLLIPVVACEEDNLTNRKTLYQNSFENTNDIKDWLGAYMLNDDTPANGGDSSLIVSGGCVIPHVYFEFGPFSKETEISVGLYGKTVLSSGSVSVRLSENQNSYRYIIINEPYWKYYEIDSSIICPANESLIIELNCGGFSPGSMLVDLFKIFEVNDIN